MEKAEVFSLKALRTPYVSPNFPPSKRPWWLYKPIGRLIKEKWVCSTQPVWNGSCTPRYLFKGLSIRCHFIGVSRTPHHPYSLAQSQISKHISSLSLLESESLPPRSKALCLQSTHIPHPHLWGRPRDQIISNILSIAVKDIHSLHCNKITIGIGRPRDQIFK